MQKKQTIKAKTRQNKKDNKPQILLQALFRLSELNFLFTLLQQLIIQFPHGFYKVQECALLYVQDDFSNEPHQFPHE